MTLLWDAHICLPLHPDASLAPLHEYRKLGVHYVSLNVGMDFNSIDQIMVTLAGFRASIQRDPELTLAGDLQQIRRDAKRGLLSVGFDLEGAVPLLDRPEMVSLYRALGVRQIHFAYNLNNRAAGGCHDHPMRLTKLGTSLVQAVNQAKMLMDCSHTGRLCSLDIINTSARPVVFSHSNPAALVDHPRNITDEQIKQLAGRGGVVCISGVSHFLGAQEPSVDHVVHHIQYVSDLVGVSHVGIGLDISFNQPHISEQPAPPFQSKLWWPAEIYGVESLGSLTYTPVHIWMLLSDRLTQAGFSLDEIDLILGENLARVMSEVEI